MAFTKNEKKDLLFAGLIISLAFAILLSGGYRAIFNINSALLLTFFIAFLTAGLGFLLHELAHKFTAQKYNLYAEFKAYYNGLWLALFFSLFGFILAAPGAVYIRGWNISREKNGKISLAGPMTNIFLSLIFLILIFIPNLNPFINNISLLGLKINSLLAAFNMIPVMPFDGAKIKDWSMSIYVTTLIVSIGLFIASFFF